MKLPNWQLKFEAFMRQRRSQPFAWGSNDCCIFAADCAMAITGRDPAPNLRSHTTAKEAYRTLQQHGGIVGVATQAWGEPVPAAFAQIGDVVLTKAGKRDMLAVCNGGTLLAPAAGGLESIGLQGATLCWRVR